MFVRVKKSGSKNSPRRYLQIVESFRDGKSVRQRVICTLGRIDELKASGQIDSMVKSLSRFSDTLRVLSAAKDPRISTCKTKQWGPALIFERLWQEQGLPQVIQRFAADRRFQFDIERTCFALALHRLSEPGSDLQASQWLQTIECNSFENIALQHLYRTTGFLYDIRVDLEKELYLRDRDLFSQKLDLLFIDTTSTYVYRDTETAYRKRGYSRDRRPDLVQMVLCIAVNSEGWPIAWDIFPGNTADMEAFSHIVNKLRQRFKIGKIIIVADRGMMSAKTIEHLVEDTDAPYEYILGCRMRRQKEVREEILTCGGRYQEVSDNLEVKEVLFDGRRYVICRNREEANKDAAARQAILEKLQETLSRKGQKAVIGNKGFARFLKIRKGSVKIDPKAVEADSRFDGKFVLRTNSALTAAQVAETYKGLWRVERTFREEKSTLQIRPIYHHCDDTSIGHIVAGFLALRLEVDLQRRLDEKGIETSWPDLMRDLKQLQAVRINLDGTSYRIRTDFEGVAHRAFKAAGVQPPSRVSQLQ